MAIKESVANGVTHVPFNNRKRVKTVVLLKYQTTVVKNMGPANDYMPE